ncbi:MAG: sigma-54-dependent Fis family transcriptional regulator [Candidatus Eisenbacteria bacterium]|uniref:Sigma-54-dependent Fis family transcriptional regulator n=1 Tax=Eiseniibacteriota bacterium TaxID=2212470 RepID=A0A933SDS2_UNCEI|nr:sigma-54-dependent Fis family transcriptional regulator [Candidatus Eisenbacteria bacterium]
MSKPEGFALLVVDDDAAIRRQLRGVLEDEGHRVSEAANAAEGYAAVERERFDAVLLDLRMPGEHGLDALLRLRERAPDTAVLIVSGEGTLENAVKAGQRGAFDFVEKPIRDPERLLDTIAEAVRVTRLRRRAAAPAGTDGDATLGILGESAPIERLREQLRRIGPSNGRVLVTGENGAGKELVAEAIHRLSKRAEGPYVKLNCAAIPRDLLESELFGYEKGAFTGAVQTKKGRLELADGGTLFLDEIGDLALESQAKLLRAIETGEIERVGGTRSSQLDVRIVAATNKDLAEAVKAGDFREDLYFRLNVLPIVVPPLRERRGDVGRLARHFLAAFAADEGRAGLTLGDEAIELLEDYHWPGNVRELRNLMERAVVLAPGDVIGAADLLPWLEARPEESDDAGLKGRIARSEIESIRRALEGADWNVTQAATSLGIDRTNLHRKMRKYGISRR